MKKIISICMSLALFAASAPQQSVSYTAKAGTSDEIVILYTNDVHCAIDDNIGYAGLALYKREMQAKYGDVLLVDAGDAIQGAPVGTFTQGKAITTLMNKVGYDVCIPGNHEFDFGIETLLERENELDCGYISSNIRFIQNDQLLFEPYKIVDAGGKKVAFVGVTTPETFTKTSATNFQDADGNWIYTFGEKQGKIYDYIQSGVDAARSEGTDYVILVGHLGENDVTEGWSAQEVAAHITGVDAIIDGHSHDETPMLEAVDADGRTIPITQTGTELKNIGKMVISPDGKISTELVSSVPEPEESMGFPEDSWLKLNGGKNVDAQVQASIDEINAEVDKQLGQVIGRSDFKLYDSDPETSERRVRNSETNLGDVCADAFRYVLQADVAFLNGGGFRSPIEPGSITYYDTMKVLPYGNMGCSARVTGQQILDLLEASVVNYPGETSGFPQVSGMTFMIDPDIESSVVFDENGVFVKVAGKRRIHSVMIGGEPIDPEKQYLLASHDYYLKEGGEGFIVSKKCEIVRDNVMLDIEILAAFISEALGGVIPEKYSSPFGEGRIRIGAAPAGNESEEETAVVTTTTEAALTAETQPSALLQNTTAAAQPASTTVPAADSPHTGVSDVQTALSVLTALVVVTGVSLVKKRRNEDEE